MPQMTVGLAMTLLIIGNVIAIFSDALIKTLSDDAAVYQFVFFRQLTAVLLLIPFCLTSSRQTLVNGLKWHAVRGHIWLLGAVFMVYSLNAMPLATANAIFYAAPLIMLPMAMIWFKEKLTVPSVTAGVLGFIGVLIVIRPTEIDWAAMAALVVAFTLAANNLLIRKLPKNQTVFQTLLLTNLVGMPASLGLAVFEGKPWDFAPLLTAAGSTLFILIYAGFCVLAYRSGEASKIASAEYSGLIGAVVVGVIWFDEIPDIGMAIGTAFIILPLLWLAKVESKNKRAAKKANKTRIAAETDQDIGIDISLPKPILATSPTAV